MATFTTATVVPNSRTPYSVVIRVANDGHDDDPILPVSRATLEAQLLQGPLKELIHRTANLSDLNTVTGPGNMDDIIRFTVIDGGLDATLQPPTTTCVLEFTADALTFSITFNGGEGLDPCDLLVEMRLVHSNER